MPTTKPFGNVYLVELKCNIFEHQISSAVYACFGIAASKTKQNKSIKTNTDTHAAQNHNL